MQVKSIKNSECLGIVTDTFYHLLDGEKQLYVTVKLMFGLTINDFAENWEVI